MEQCIQYQNNLKNNKKHAKINMRLLYLVKGANNGNINYFSCNSINYINSKYKNSKPSRSICHRKTW